MMPAHRPASRFSRAPFGESELLAFGKAYQDATGHHLKHPPLTKKGE